MEIRITAQNVATLIQLVEDEYEGMLNLHGSFTVEQRERQVEALEELTAIKEALEEAQRADNQGGDYTNDIGWQIVE